MAEQRARGRRGQTREAILRATAGLIAAKGVDGFTITEVGQRAGVNRALIYHYFRDRENLVAQAIDNIFEVYSHGPRELSADTVEHGIRMHIEHPEIARFFFQLLLRSRPLDTMAARLRATIEELERVRSEQGARSEYDASFAVIVLALAQLSWAFAREEFARMLGISVEEADRRFIAQMRHASSRGIEELLRQD